MKQIQNFVAYEKRKNSINKPLSVEELRQYCVANSEQPADENKPFVAGFKISGPDQVCVVWSTKKLLEKQRNNITFCVDATYKITSINWPIMVSHILYSYFKK
jgi:hypothetical protein